jgi:hypothetical protein
MRMMSEVMAVGTESFEILLRIPTAYVISLSSIIFKNNVDSYKFYFMKIWFEKLGEIINI